VLDDSKGECVLSGSRILKIISGLAELCLAIPVLGGMIVIGTAYWALVIMFVLHVVTAVLSSKNRESFYGPICGIITSLIAWVPFLGWFMHLLSGILLLVNSAQGARRA